jgi:hypothetical protein
MNDISTNNVTKRNNVRRRRLTKAERIKQYAKDYASARKVLRAKLSPKNRWALDNHKLSAKAMNAFVKSVVELAEAEG